MEMGAVGSFNQSEVAVEIGVEPVVDGCRIVAYTNDDDRLVDVEVADVESPSGR